MVERFEELWRISLEGNWKEEFSQLQKTVDASRKDWDRLRDSFVAAGAECRQQRAEGERQLLARRDRAE